MENEKSVDTRVNPIVPIVLISILAFTVIFILLNGNNFTKSKKTNETRIVEFLNSKYSNSLFQVVNLKAKWQGTTGGLSCDGSTFCPERKVRGLYYYTYEVKSTSDNTPFIVYVKEDKGDYTFKDNYDIILKGKTIANDIQNYAISLIGNENSKSNTSITLSDNPKQFCGLNIVCNITITLDDSFENIYKSDSNFIKNLNKIESYQRYKVPDEYTRFSITIRDKNGYSINNLGSEEIIVYDQNSKKMGNITTLWK
jgi:hypothetical protein